MTIRKNVFVKSQKSISWKFVVNYFKVTQFRHVNFPILSKIEETKQTA